MNGREKASTGGTLRPGESGGRGVTDPRLREIVGRLVAAYDPQRIYLFGSTSRGTASADSDYDLLILVSDDAPPERRRSTLAYQVLRGTGVAVDPVVWTTGEFRRRTRVPSSLPARVEREGHLLYRAAADADGEREGGAESVEGTNPSLQTGPPVAEIVRRIVEAADPERVILFGSAARGHADFARDLDFLVVKAGEYSKRELSVRTRRAIGDVGRPVDIVFARPEDLDRYGEASGLVYRPALREGVPVYP